MWSQKHVCAVVLVVGLIVSLVSIREKFHAEERNKTVISFVYPPNSKAKDQKVYKSYKNRFTIPDEKPLKNANNRDIIHILGLFELSTSAGNRTDGFDEMVAAQLAVQHVNNLKILSGYQLELIINDTKCDPGVGIDRFFHALFSGKRIVMLLGAGCSNVTESLANIVPYWNILQVSFGSTSPILSDRNKFPLFFRTVAPNSSHNTARMSFIKHFEWSTVAIFSLSEQSYLLSLNNFVTQLEWSNITCVATITFSLENYKEQLRMLKDLGTRIIIGSFPPSVASKIFCEVYELKMFGKEYVWILQNENEIWWENAHECNKRNLQESVEGLIFVSEYNLLSTNETSVSGLTNEDFRKEIEFVAKVSSFAAQAYDAIWAMALTLQHSIQCKPSHFLSSFDYKKPGLAQEFVERMELLRFTGISGPVRFNGADRIGNSIFQQIQGGVLKEIAIFYADTHSLDFNCNICSSILFSGGQIPVGQRILQFKLVRIPQTAFYIIFAFSICGIIMSLTFLYFNLRFRRMKTMKLSSPRLNNIVVMGCIVVYVAVVLLGVDKSTAFFNVNASQLCTIRVYLLSAGFSLAFGSIFAKTYRVHRIFTYSVTMVKDKLLKDKQLIALIFLLLLIDGFIILLWLFLDPMQTKLKDLPVEVSVEHRGVVYQPQVEVCRSENTPGWFIAIYGYKGFLLIMGVYMAWETRHVKIPSLNDSQYIGISVYSVVFCSMVVILSNSLANYITFSYLATTISILISTTITVVLLFLPKLKAIFGKVDGENVVVQSMGLKIECNTRRLVAFDQREVLYRMEVQNRVYRTELLALDVEIARLEALLRSPPKITFPTFPNVSSFKLLPCFIPLPLLSSARASWPSMGTSSAEFPSSGNAIRRASGNDRKKLAAVAEKPFSTPEFSTQSAVGGEMRSITEYPLFLVENADLFIKK